jgi:hypothetical protein
VSNNPGQLHVTLRRRLVFAAALGAAIGLLTGYRARAGELPGGGEHYQWLALLSGLIVFLLVLWRTSDTPPD